MMRTLKELAGELVEMLLAERRLTLAVLALVAKTGLLVDFAGLQRLARGAMLLFGSLTVLVASAWPDTRAGASQDTPT